MGDLAQGSDLLDRLAQSGLFEEQLRPLRLQQQLAQGMMGTPGAQGRNVGNTYVSASPLEHLSGLAQKLVGALMQKRAMGKEQDLATQLGQARGDYGKALASAAAPVQHPPEGIVSPDYNPQAAEQQHQQQLQQLGMAGMLSGDPVMSHAAQYMTDPKLAMERQALEQGAKKFPLELAMEQQRLAAGGPQEALGGRTQAVFDSLTKAAQVPKVMSVSPGSSVVDARTGKSLGGPAGGAAGGLTPEALDQHARKYLQDQTLPSLGKGNLVGHMAIINRAAELGGNQSLAANHASTKADTGSLASQQKILDNAESWERTGKANLNVLLGVAQKLKDTGSPWINSPVRLFMDKGAGDPNQAAFRAAHATVVNEYAKILSGAQGSGAVTEGARHEAESMLPLDATWDQLSAAAKVLDTDAGNRIGSARQQVGQIRGRISGTGGEDASVRQAGHVPGFEQSPGPMTNGSGGKERSFKRVNGKLVEVTQ